MRRIGRWTHEQMTQTVRQFKNGLAKDRVRSEVNHAKDCGFSLGRVLVLRNKKITDLSKADLEVWRRRYAVVRRYSHVMTTCANASRSYWLRWFEQNYQGTHPGPMAH